MPHGHEYTKKKKKKIKLHDYKLLNHKRAVWSGCKGIALKITRHAVINLSLSTTENHVALTSSSPLVARRSRYGVIIRRNWNRNEPPLKTRSPPVSLTDSNGVEGEDWSQTSGADYTGTAFNSPDVSPAVLRSRLRERSRRIPVPFYSLAAVRNRSRRWLSSAPLMNSPSTRWACARRSV